MEIEQCVVSCEGRCAGSCCPGARPACRVGSSCGLLRMEGHSLGSRAGVGNPVLCAQTPAFLSSKGSKHLRVQLCSGRVVCFVFRDAAWTSSDFEQCVIPEPRPGAVRLDGSVGPALRGECEITAWCCCRRGALSAGQQAATKQNARDVPAQAGLPSSHPAAPR